MEDGMITTFPNRGEFEKAVNTARSLSIEYMVIEPGKEFSFVAEPAIVVNRNDMGQLANSGGFSCPGWVDYRESALRISDDLPQIFEEDIFGKAVVVVLAPCMADPEKIRIIAHLTGDISSVLPYINAIKPDVSYHHTGSTLTYRDGYRMISLYSRRVTVARADEIIDAWRVLKDIRCLVNETWARRGEIKPSYETRKRPPALEILKRLPQTNCGECGEKTCTAFAVAVYEGNLPVSMCIPVFKGDYGQFREPLLEICAGLGIVSEGKTEG